jgi:hypothetical protein
MLYLNETSTMIAKAAMAQKIVFMQQVSSDSKTAVFGTSLAVTIFCRDRRARLRQVERA